ncbi:MAG: hypothetical protein J6M62_11215 [Selenomonadaceae bacterium]|nr:hypothetical protein [Selenomonadaceae bacterium]MBO6305623.1 hypothetical protein [Selenomonadaceae bacterium]
MQEPRIEKLYGIWRCMKYRCNSESKNNHYAPYYRDRGIRVCEIWSKDFFKFQEWSLENGYKEGLTIDRIDGNGNYEPSNCRWVTMAENSRNKQKNIKIQEENFEVRQLQKNPSNPLKSEIPIKSKGGKFSIVLASLNYYEKPQIVIKGLLFREAKALAKKLNDENNTRFSDYYYDVEPKHGKFYWWANKQAT